MKDQIEQYKSLLENISLARQVNESLANKLIVEFCERLEGQLMLLHEIKEDREAAKAVYDKLEIISSTLINRAAGFYKKLPDTLYFKEFLLRCHEEANLAFINNQIPRACRSAFRQIETLVDYIVTEMNLIGWLLDSPNDWANYRVYVNPNADREANRQSVTKSIALVNKIWLVNSYFSAFFKNHPDCKYSLVKTYDRDKYYSCYNLRNADSHGWNFKTSLDSQEIKLKEVADNFEDCMRELTKIIVPLRDLIGELNKYNGTDLNFRHYHKSSKIMPGLPIT